MLIHLIACCRRSFFCLFVESFSCVPSCRERKNIIVVCVRDVQSWLLVRGPSRELSSKGEWGFQCEYVICIISYHPCNSNLRLSITHIVTKTNLSLTLISDVLQHSVALSGWNFFLVGIQLRINCVSSLIFCKEHRLFFFRWRVTIRCSCECHPAASSAEWCLLKYSICTSRRQKPRVGFESVFLSFVGN